MFASITQRHVLIYVAWLNTKLWLYVFLSSFFVGVTALADTWLPPRATETPSEDGVHVFRCRPEASTGGKFYKPGTCQGSLYSKRGKKMVLCWQRPLINDVCPVSICVSNSGKYVATFAEWGDYVKLPVVIYGVDGSLVNVYGHLRQIIPYFSGNPRPGFITGKGLSHSISGTHWLSHALIFFGPKENFLVVRLSNKEVMVFETKTGKLVDNSWMEESSVLGYKLKEYEDFKNNLDWLIILETLRLVASDSPNERNEGLFILKQCNDEKSLSFFREMLKDRTVRVINRPDGRMREYPLRKAAKEALKVHGKVVPGDVVTEESMGQNSAGWPR